MGSDLEDLSRSLPGLDGCQHRLEEVRYREEHEEIDEGLHQD